MNRLQKTQQVEELKELFGELPLMVLTKYTGLDVASMVELRTELRKVSGGYRVVKNTLAKLANAETERDKLDPYFTGPVGVAYSGEDPAATAKVLTTFAKSHPKMEIRAGLLAGGTILDAAAVDALGKLPGKDQLRAMLLGTLHGVPRNFLGVCNAAARSFVGVLEARRQALAED